MSPVLSVIEFVPEPFKLTDVILNFALGGVVEVEVAVGGGVSVGRSRGSFVGFCGGCLTGGGGINTTVDVVALVTVGTTDVTVMAWVDVAEF